MLNSIILIKKNLILRSYLITFNTYAQSVGIKNENPDASAALDITSTTGVILIPIMTKIQRDDISAAATGLMIYQTDVTVGFYYYDRSSWVNYYSQDEVDELIASLEARITTLEFKNIEVGDYYQGGVVFYLFVDGDTGYVAGVKHGLIAAVEDQSSGIKWHNGFNVTTGATATAVATRSANTTRIINVQSGTEIDYAAGLARLTVVEDIMIGIYFLKMSLI